jgi:lysophospholipid acyltransferase (LPLAT)-like uncharacterized protein
MAVSTSKPRGIVIPHELPWHKRAAVAILCACTRVYVATWRGGWTVSTEKHSPADGPVIFCVWHNRLAMAVPNYGDFIREHWPANGLAALVSASRDGAFLSSILEHFGIQAIRGSSSRRGPQALLEATTFISEKNYNIVITPDGPRGPCYRIDDGIISLARLTGRPIVPLCFEARPKWRLRSWDKFQLPWPFARCRFSYGPAFFVPRDADDAQREKIRVSLESTMLEINTP